MLSTLFGNTRPGSAGLDPSRARHGVVEYASSGLTNVGGWVQTDPNAAIPGGEQRLDCPVLSSSKCVGLHQRDCCCRTEMKQSSVWRNMRMGVRDTVDD